MVQVEGTQNMAGKFKWKIISIAGLHYIFSRAYYIDKQLPRTFFLLSWNEQYFINSLALVLKKGLKSVLPVKILFVWTSFFYFLFPFAHWILFHLCLIMIRNVHKPIRKYATLFLVNHLRRIAKPTAARFTLLKWISLQEKKWLKWDVRSY